MKLLKLILKWGGLVRNWGPPIHPCSNTFGVYLGNVKIFNWFEVSCMECFVTCSEELRVAGASTLVFVFFDPMWCVARGFCSFGSTTWVYNATAQTNAPHLKVLLILLKSLFFSTPFCIVRESVCARYYQKLPNSNCFVQASVTMIILWLKYGICDCL